MEEYVNAASSRERRELYEWCCKVEPSDLGTRWISKIAVQHADELINTAVSSEGLHIKKKIDRR